MADKKTGYLKINRFTETTYDEFKEHMANLQKQGMKQLLLDLHGLREAIWTELLI